MSSFTINPASNDVKLDAKRAGNARFTVSNTTAKPVRGTPALIWADSKGRTVEEPTRKDWLNVVGGTVARSFESKDNKTLDVEIKVPPTAEPGEYFLRLAVSNEADPDKDFEVGPAVKFKVEGVTPQPNGKPFPWWILIVVAVVLVVGGITLVVVLRPSKVTVPDVVRKPLGEASNSLTKVELSVEVAEQRATGTNQIGMVIGQNPPAGAKVVKGAIIDLTVEKELDRVSTPDLIGLPPEKLQTVYGNVPVKLVQEKRAYTGKQQPGLISEQKPLPGTPVEPKATINYTVEDRKPDDPVPPYVGNWVNENPNSTRLARFTISWRDKRAYVHVWMKRGDPPDLGEKEAKVTGNQLETAWNLGIANVTLVMNLEGQRMRVTQSSRWMGAVGAAGRAEVATEFFTPQRTYIQLYKAPALERSAVLSPKFLPK